MKSLFIGGLLALTSMFAIVASAQAADPAFDFSGGLGGAAGLTYNNSGASNWSETQKFGSATSEASGEGYGLSESTLTGKFETAQPGSHATKLEGSVKVGSGSLSNVATTSNGNGSSSASSGGEGFGAGISLGGVAQLGGSGGL